MAGLLAKGNAPANIRYVTGELIDDHHALVRVLTEILSESGEPGLRFLAVDEVTYVAGWDRGIKFLVDAGVLDETIVVLTGSDSVLIKDLVGTLPGRRGKADAVDFRLRPLSFREVVELKRVLASDETQSLADPAFPVGRPLSARLSEAFGSYLIHGGFLTAINDMAQAGRVSASTLATYADWIRGDVMKRGKSERYLREVLQAILARECSQVTWNALAKDLTLDHPATVASYVSLLESMDVVLVQSALAEHRLSPAPKKAKKVMFADPFIRHAVNAWLLPKTKDAHADITRSIEDPETASRLAEAVAVQHFARTYPTYYVKGDRGEVDIAYVSGRRFHPVEVKWTRQLRPGDLKQVALYPDALILDRSPAPHRVLGISAQPLPVVLFRLG